MRPGIIEAPPPCAGSCGRFSNPVRIRCRSVVVLLSSYRDAAIVPLPRRVTAVLPRRRHRRAASSMSCCAAVVPLRCRRHTATAPSFCRGAYDADNVLSDVLPPNRPGRQRPSSRALALRFVHNLPKRVVLPIAVRVFPSFQQFFPFPPLCDHYLGRTAEKMIRRCSVREEVFKSCNSGQGASWDRLASEGASRLRTAERGRENRRKRVIQSAKPENGKGGEPIIRRTLSECGGCSSGLSYDGKLAQ